MNVHRLFPRRKYARQSVRGGTRRVPGALLCLGLFPLTLAALVPFRITRATPDARSGQASGWVRDGVYTETQALRGQALYEEHCEVCHGARLEGQDETFAALRGEAFMSKWGKGNLSVDDLFYIVRTQMPYGDAGTLSRQAYIDIISFLLQQNGYAAGDEELPLDPERLKAILITPQPDESGNP